MQNEKTPIDSFIDEIKDIDEVDYGDFMRKANHALTILMDKIYDSSNPKVKHCLEELKFIIQFLPNWNVELTREKTFSIARDIKLATQEEITNHPQL
jgi:hypothetical protein